MGRTEAPQNVSVVPPWKDILNKNNFVDFRILIGDLPACWPLSSFTLLGSSGLALLSPHSSKLYGSHPPAGAIILQILFLLIDSLGNSTLKHWSSSLSVGRKHRVGLLKDTAQGAWFRRSGMNLRICIYKFLDDASTAGVGTTLRTAQRTIITEPTPLVDDALKTRIVSSHLFSFSFLSLGFWFVCL